MQEETIGDQTEARRAVIRSAAQLARVAVLVSLTVALGGCSNDAENSDDGDVSLEHFLAERSDALCRWSVKCGVLPNAESCVDVGLFDWSLLEADMAAGVIRYDAALARPCLEHVNSDAYQSCSYAEDEGWEPACGHVLAGTLEDGETCSSSGQCLPGAWCDTSLCGPDAACCTGTCATPAAVGSACASGWLCEDHAYCDSGGICRPEVADGSECTGPWMCGSSSMCNSGESEQGVCVPLALVGEACDPAAQGCADWDTWCNPATERCERASDIGGPCSGYDGCLLYAYCDGSTCWPLGSVGDACAGAPCLLYLECQDNLCAPLTEHCAEP